MIVIAVSMWFVAILVDSGFGWIDRGFFCPAVVSSFTEGKNAGQAAKLTAPKRRTAAAAPGKV